jgi:hypothetical protein
MFSELYSIFGSAKLCHRSVKDLFPSMWAQEVLLFLLTEKGFE